MYVCRRVDNIFMTESSTNFIRELAAMITAPDFAGVSSSMYVPITVLKDFAQANTTLQFLIMAECEGKFLHIDFL